MPVTILQDAEFERVIQLETGTRVILSTDDSYSVVNVDVLDGNTTKRIGYFEFDQPGFCPADVYRLAYMSLEQGTVAYKRRGIGRAILEFFIRVTGAHLVCEQPGGPKNDYATHVTDEGIPFVSKMKEEGLIWFKDDDLDED